MSTCYPLSRLKGIETETGNFFQHLFVSLLPPFPFEGNWNTSTSIVSTAPSLYWLATPFPVWRELKLILCRSDSSMAINLATPFPVWRELKLLPHSPFTLRITNLLPPFPFEGNWNVNKRITNGEAIRLLPPFPFEGNWNYWYRYLRFRLRSPCYPLSRLKGIETTAYKCVTRRFCALLPPFPFEGNWNLGTESHVMRKVAVLATPFPVWRELKQIEISKGEATVVACYPLSRLKGIETVDMPCGFAAQALLATPFPVWRELKLKPP